MSSIIARETAAAVKLGTTNVVKIPAPDAKTKQALESLGVVFGDKIDHVLQKVTLPEGWYIKQTSTTDARHRAIFNTEHSKIAVIFFKDSGYDYYGSTTLQ
jgi:hypothetical protein